jgi:DUF971 family protein
MAQKPLEVRRLGAGGISIRWAGGEFHEISSEKLRTNCPCATCKELRGDTSHAKPLTGKKSSLMIVESSKDEETRLDEIWGVGQYAIGMKWGDGHTTGIYTFDKLHELGEET